MARIALPLPRRRRWRIALAVAGALLLYLVALSVVPALFSGKDAVAERLARV